MKDANKKIVLRQLHGANRKSKNIQCILCQANFQVWLNNLNISEEREEKISKQFLQYCPSCEKAGEK